jgi:arsenate reductase
MRRIKVLFVCTANSCRSQIAEAWARRLWPGHMEAFSAGLVTYPISARTRETMAEVGISMVDHHSKTIDEFNLDDFDLVVTLSEESGRFLPLLRQPHRHLHDPIFDPMGATGSREQVTTLFRQARDRIRTLVEALEEHPVLAERPRESPGR